MPTLIETNVTFRDGMKFLGTSRSGKTVEIDHVPGDVVPEGYSPLELLLASLAGCSGQVVVGLLKRMGQDVRGLVVRAKGLKNDVHPTVFTSIELDFEFTGGRIDGPSVENAFALSEDRFCPVWVMLKASVPITAKYQIIAA
ncbi:MAG: OsmC family protein [Candidatus Aminicenantales bacterium]